MPEVTDLFKSNSTRKTLDLKLYKASLQQKVKADDGSLANGFLAGWTSLKRIDVGHLAEIGVTRIESGFLSGCTSLESIDGLLELSAVATDVDLTDIFKDCSSLNIDPELLRDGCDFLKTPLGCAVRVWKEENVARKEDTCSKKENSPVPVSQQRKVTACAVVCVLVALFFWWVQKSPDVARQRASSKGGCACAAEALRSSAGDTVRAWDILRTPLQTLGSKHGAALEPMFVSTSRHDNAADEITAILASAPCCRVASVPWMQWAHTDVVAAWGTYLRGLIGETSTRCHIVVVPLELMSEDVSLHAASIALLNSAKEIVEDGRVRGVSLAAEERDRKGAVMPQVLIVFTSPVASSEVMHISGVQHRAMHVMHREEL